MTHHVSNSSCHLCHKQQDEVQEQNRPENGEIENREEGGEEGDDYNLKHGSPNLELGYLGNEWFVLVGLLLLLPANGESRSGKSATFAFIVVVVLVLGIRQGGDEHDEAVEEVDAHGVADDVVSSNEDENAKEVEEEKSSEGRPSGEFPRNDVVLQLLVFSFELQLELVELTLMT